MPNFRFTEFDILKSDGSYLESRSSHNQNLACIHALRTLRKVRAEEREATEYEQARLAGFPGWGAVPQLLSGAKGYRSERKELKELLSLEELERARAASLNAHYTPPSVISAVWAALPEFGLRGGRVLEPGCGIGHWLGLAPQSLSWVGVELDPVSCAIARLLYPEGTSFYNRDFLQVPLPTAYFDAAVGNVPFSDGARYEYDGIGAKVQLHNAVIAKAVDLVRPGGVIALITSTGSLQSSQAVIWRRWVEQKAVFLGALRLPGGTFAGIANTDVSTDLLVMRRRGAGVDGPSQPWIELTDSGVKDAEGRVLWGSEYYLQHPEHLLGTQCDDKLYPGRLALAADGRDLPRSITEALLQIAREERGFSYLVKKKAGSGHELKTRKPGNFWAEFVADLKSQRASPALEVEEDVAGVIQGEQLALDVAVVPEPVPGAKLTAARTALELVRQMEALRRELGEVALAAAEVPLGSGEVSEEGSGASSEEVLRPLRGSGKRGTRAVKATAAAMLAEDSDLNRVKVFAYCVKDGELCVLLANGLLEPVRLPVAKQERILGLMAVRDCAQELLDAQLSSDLDEPVRICQAALSEVYRRFVKRWGYLHERGNLKAFEGDPDAALLLSLEIWDADGKTATQADLFSKRLIYPRSTPEPGSVSDVLAALLICLNEQGNPEDVDLVRIAELLGRSVSEVRQELIEQELIFPAPPEVALA